MPYDARLEQERVAVRAHLVVDLDRPAVAPAALGDRVALDLGREAGSLEEHHHQRDVLGVAAVRVELDALLGGLLDAVDLASRRMQARESSFQPRASSVSWVRVRWELPWSKPPAAPAARA